MGAINTIRQESVKLLQLEDGLLTLLDTKPMQVPENRSFTMDYLKALGAMLGCGIVTLLFLKDLFTVGDILAKLIGLVCILGFGFGTVGGWAAFSNTRKEQTRFQLARKEAIDFNAKLEKDKKTLAKAYQTQQAKLRKAKQLVPELKNRPLFFDTDYVPAGVAGVCYRSFENSFVALSGEPVLRKARFNDRDALIFDGHYPDKHCLVKEAIDALAKQDYYYLVKDEALIAQNLNSVCNFNLITDNVFQEEYLAYHTGGDTGHLPAVRLAYMHANYSDADWLILGGTGGNFNYSSVPDTRDQRTPPSEIPERIDFQKTHMRHRNYRILTLRLGYIISIPNPWRILCIAVPKYPIEQQNWAINRIHGSPYNSGKGHLVGELIATYDEIMEKAGVEKLHVDPIRVAEYLISDSDRLQELPPFDPFQPPPNGMDADVWRAILRLWSAERPALQSDKL